MKVVITISFLFSLCSGLFGQIQLIDAKTKEPVPGVHFISDKGTLLGLTDIKGILNMRDCKGFSDSDLVEISHISYKKKKISFERLKKIKLIEIEEDLNLLNEVEITGKKRDYLILKGYFRSYQIDDDIPKSFMDGIVEYFIPLRKNGLKVNILENRYFRNPSNYEILLKKKKFLIGSSGTSGDRVGPPYIKTKTILDSEKFDLNLIKQNNGRIITENDTIGLVDVDTLNNFVTINVDLITPKNQYSKSLFNFKTQFVNLSIIERYSSSGDLWNSKSNLLFRTAYQKQFVSHKRRKTTIKVESFSEFYVLEKKYISRKEFRKRKKSSFFGPKKSNYSTNFWLEPELNKIVPKLPVFIDSLLYNQLTEC